MTSFERTVTNEKPVKEEELKNPGKSGAQLVRYRNGIRAIIKESVRRLPNKRKTQRGIPVSSHPYREVAFYRMAKLLGWEDLVAETVLVRKDGRVFSAQIYTPSLHLPEIEPRLEDVDRADWMSLLRDTCLMGSIDDWRRVVVLDLINGSRDRHVNGAGVVIKLGKKAASYHPLLWDNAVSGGCSFERYYSIFHRALFAKAINLDPFFNSLTKLTFDDIQKATSGLWTPEEQGHALQRAKFILRYPYRIPWNNLSKGIEDKDEFPSYASQFNTLTTPQSPGNLLLIV